MENQKVELSIPYPIRIPLNVVEDLKKSATNAQRSFSQELRFRILESWSRIQKTEFE